MNDRRDVISAHTLGALLVFCKVHPDAGNVRDIIDEAVADWLVRHQVQTDAESGAGYRWKTIFLPAGTDIRLDYGGKGFHARVIGDELVFEGRAVTPRQMLMQVTGLSGNTWHWLFVRRPGEQHFIRADALRARVARAAATKV
jgi:hypothetical protein